MTLSLTTKNKLQENDETTRNLYENTILILRKEKRNIEITIKKR
jgi:hypothetical protein